MTPKTQRVCKHCHEKIFRAHSSWQTSEGFLTCMHNKSSFSAGHEPVAEPASTGEPPLTGGWPCQSCGYGHETGTGCPPKKRAARPSEPSAPQKSAIEIAGERDLKVITEPIDWEAVENDAAPQTSAEPRKQCGCVHGDSDQYCPDPLCPNYIAAYHVKPPCPQPVSGDAPTWIMKPCPKEFAAIMSSPADWLITRVDGNSRHTLYFSNDELEKLCQGYLQVIPLERLKELRAPDPAPSPTPSVSTEPTTARLLKIADEIEQWAKARQKTLPSRGDWNRWPAMIRECAAAQPGPDNSHVACSLRAAVLAFGGDEDLEKAVEEGRMNMQGEWLPAPAQGTPEPPKVEAAQPGDAPQKEKP